MSCAMGRGQGQGLGGEGVGRSFVRLLWQGKQSSA